MAQVGYEARPKERVRLKPPDFDDGFHYVIAEKPGPDDEGSSPEDMIDDMNYEFVGEISRRKNLWRIPKADRAAIEKAFQEKSRRNAKAVSSVKTEDGRELEGVVKNYIEEEKTEDINKLLN